MHFLVVWTFFSVILFLCIYFIIVIAAWRWIGTWNNPKCMWWWTPVLFFEPFLTNFTFSVRGINILSHSMKIFSDFLIFYALFFSKSSPYPAIAQPISTRFAFPEIDMNVLCFGMDICSHKWYFWGCGDGQKQLLPYSVLTLPFLLQLTILSWINWFFRKLAMFVAQYDLMLLGIVVTRDPL